MQEQSVSEDKKKETTNESADEQTIMDESNVEEEHQDNVEENLDESSNEESAEENNYIDELTESLKELENEKKDLQEKLLRIHAEYDNYKKRTEKEKLAERKYKSQDLAIELLPVLDNFDRALQTEVSSENQSFKEGMQMVYEQFQTALKSQGIEPIDALHQPFDPNEHHAVMQTEDDQFEANIVVEELQKGYTLKDKIIRPAMVKVNK